MEHHDEKYVTQEEFCAALHRFEERMTSMEASQQGQIDALTASLVQVETDLGTVTTDLTASNAAIQAELDALQAQIDAGGPVDLSAITAAAAPLDAQVTALDAAVKAVGTLTPTPPAPPAS